MQRYATDNEHRKVVFYICAGLGIASQWVLRGGLNYFGFDHFSVVVAAPSAIGFAGIFYALFDRFLWDRFFFRKIFKITDFSGRWCGYIVNRNGYSKRNRLFEKVVDEFIPIELVITQTFSKIQINFVSYNQMSRNNPGESTSILTGIFKSDGNRPELKYVFQKDDMIGYNILRYKRGNDAKFLQGEYFSNKQRIGKMTLVKHRKGRKVIMSEPMRLKNRAKRDYLACQISSSTIARYTPYFREVVGDNKKFELLRNHRSARDGQDHHMTIFSAEEFAQISTDELEEVKSFMSISWISVLGIGRAASENKIDNFESFFLVCESRKLNEMRKRLGFSKRDFHITLGFLPEDLHNVSKSKDTLVG